MRSFGLRLLFAVGAVPAVLIALRADPAVAYVYIKEMSFKQTPDNEPEIHVAFRDGNWRDLTSDVTEFRFHLTYKARSSIVPTPRFTISIPDQTRMEWGAPGREKSAYFNIRARARDLPTLGKQAIEVCQAIRANGGTPEKTHRVAQHIVPGKGARFVLDLQGSHFMDSKTRSAAIRFFVVCKNDPTFKKPHLNAPVTSASLDVDLVPSSSGGCPWKVEWRAKFRATKSYRYYTFHLKRRIEPLSPPGRETRDTLKYKVDISTAVSGGFRGQFSGQYNYPASRQKLRIVVPGTDIKSPWQSVDINCGTSEEFKVLSAELSLTRKAGQTCDAVEARVTFKTNRPGDVPFKLHRPGADITKTIKSKAVGSGKFTAVFTKTQSFDKEMDAKYMAETPTTFPGPYGLVSSGWKDIAVKCIKPLRGTLTLKKAKGGGCRGEALVAIHTNRAGRIPYELVCGPGRTWMRKAQAPANRIAADKVSFKAKHGEQVTCVLRTWLEGKPKNLDAKSHKFRCLTGGGKQKMRDRGR